MTITLQRIKEITITIHHKNKIIKYHILLIIYLLILYIYSRETYIFIYDLNTL